MFIMPTPSAAIICISRICWLYFFQHRNQRLANSGILAFASAELHILGRATWQKLRMDLNITNTLLVKCKKNKKYDPTKSQLTTYNIQITTSVRARLRTHISLIDFLRSEGILSFTKYCRLEILFTWSGKYLYYLWQIYLTHYTSNFITIGRILYNI